MKVAIVYDRVNKWGGAERVLLALHKIWPTAPLYTAVYDKNHASWADVFSVHPSFLQKIPMAKNMHELLPWATPIAFESFTFDAYDVVISVTSAEAKYIITKPTTMHICYCLTPTRYLWSGYASYQSNPGWGLIDSLVRLGLNISVRTLRRWDLIGAQRPDYYIAISNRVKQRIARYYKRRVDKVIYPPVDVLSFQQRKNNRQGKYFITVSRLVGYKRVDLIIDAFNKLDLPLVVIGNGREKNRLIARAKQNIHFIENVTDLELAKWYLGSRAFVYAADEDFGIAAVEALASGVPLIAYRNSGLSEVLTSDKTGILYEEQSTSAIVAAVESFRDEWYDSALCRKRAEMFSAERFMIDMKETVESLYNRYTQTL